MEIIRNTSKSILYLGRFRLRPGQDLPSFPLTASERVSVEHFLKLGRLTTVAVPEPEKVVPAVAAEPCTEDRRKPARRRKAEHKVDSEAKPATTEPSATINTSTEEPEAAPEVKAEEPAPLE